MQPTPERTRDVLAVVRALDPGRRSPRIAVLGAGLDHDAFDVDGELIVRFAREPDPEVRAADTRREAEVLEAVAAVSPVAVPVPVLVAPEDGCLAYRRLPGVPVLDLQGPLAGGAADELGALLAAVHALDLAIAPDDASPAAWREEAAAAYVAAAASVPAELRGAVETFLVAPLPPDDHHPVLCHNDLGAEHLLADPETGRLTGVVDWGDAAIADPAHDLGLILRDLGGAAFRRVLARTELERADPGIAERARFHACCKALEDLAYGLEPGRDAYAEAARAALGRLFGEVA